MRSYFFLSTPLDEEQSWYDNETVLIRDMVRVSVVSPVALAPLGNSAGAFRVTTQFCFYPWCQNCKTDSVFASGFDIAERVQLNISEYIIHWVWRHYGIALWPRGYGVTDNDLFLTTAINVDCWAGVVNHVARLWYVVDTENLERWISGYSCLCCSLHHLVSFCSSRSMHASKCMARLILVFKCREYCHKPSWSFDELSLHTHTHTHIYIYIYIWLWNKNCKIVYPNGINHSIKNAMFTSKCCEIWLHCMYCTESCACLVIVFQASWFPYPLATTSFELQLVLYTFAVL